MKRMKLYLLLTCIIFIMGGIIYLLMDMPTNDKKSLDNIDTSTNSTKSNTSASSTVNNAENKYTEEEIKKGQEKTNIENKTEEKVKEFITFLEAPLTENEYEKALKMTHKQLVDRLQEAYPKEKIVSDGERSLDNISLDTEYTTPKQMNIDVSYDLTYTDKNEVKTTHKKGIIKINTNEKGYFYIEDVDIEGESSDE